MREIKVLFTYVTDIELVYVIKIRSIHNHVSLLLQIRFTLQLGARVARYIVFGKFR